MTDALETRLDFGAELIARAMTEARAAFQAPATQVHVKTPGDLVTDADLRIEKLLTSAIAARYPGDDVLGEEGGGSVATDRFGWLIDPIDGTVNFARGLAYYCVSVALVAEGRVVSAWIADPQSGEVFHCGPAGPAMVNDAVLPPRPPRDAAAPVLVGVGFSSRHDPALNAGVTAALTGGAFEFRRLGAGALCLAHVAAGRLDAYIEPHMNPWDGAGGLHLAAVSGAVTLEYPDLRRGGVVFAADPAIADRLLSVLPDPFSSVPFAAYGRAGAEAP